MTKNKLDRDDYYAYHLSGYKPSEDDPDFSEHELVFIQHAFDMFDYAQAIMEAKVGHGNSSLRRAEARALYAGIAAATVVPPEPTLFLEAGDHSG